MSVDSEVVKKKRGRPKKVVVEPSSTTSKKTSPKKSRKKTSTKEPAEQANSTKSTEVSQKAEGAATKSQKKTTTTAAASPSPVRSEPVSDRATKASKLPPTSSKSAPSSTQKAENTSSEKASSNKETDNSAARSSSLGTSHPTQASIANPVHSPARASTVLAEEKTIGEGRKQNSKSSPSKTATTTQPPPRESPVLAAIASSRSLSSSTTKPDSHMPPAGKKKTPASELAKAMNQSKQSPNVKLSPPKPAPIVRTQEEIRQMGRQGVAPTRNPDITHTKQYKSAARRWTATIIAVPILLCTSYALYQRVFFDKQPRALPGVNDFSSSRASSSTIEEKAINDK